MYITEYLEPIMRNICEWYIWVTMLNTILYVETKKLGHMLHVWVGRDVRYEIVRLKYLVVEKLLLVAKATNINFSSRAGGGCKGLTWPFTSRDPLTSCDPPYATPSLYATRPLTLRHPLTRRDPLAAPRADLSYGAPISSGSMQSGEHLKHRLRAASRPIAQSLCLACLDL